MFNQNILFLLLSCISLCNAHERITLFESDIVIESQGKIIVQETIEVVSEHKQILHGIIREFSTQYRDTLGSYHTAIFRLISITHNQESAIYSIKQNYKGNTIFIGDKNTIIPQGKHRYIITYEMNYRLSFFDNFDEFFWNVTGDRWLLPIEVVQGHIHLPDNDSKNLITTKIFTTYHGTHRNNDYNQAQDKTISIKPFYLLRPRESLTVLVKFPKGFFIQATLDERQPEPLGYDTLSLALIVIFLFYFIIFIIFLIFVWLNNKSNNIMPTSYPPQNMTPSEVGFIMNKRFSAELLIADIIDMVHLEFITITSTDNQYKIALEKSINLNDSSILNHYYKKLLTTLFKKYKSIVIAEKYISKTNKALKICQDHVSKHHDLFYRLINFNNKKGLRIIIALFIILAFYGIYITNNFIADDFIIHAIAIICSITFLLCFFISIFSLYTHKGKQKQNEIYAFKLYLMNGSIKTQYYMQDYPIKTIELYEQYIPYAIALGVEKEWTRQFVHILDIVENKGQSSSIKLQFFNLYLLNNFIKVFSQVSTLKNSSEEHAFDYSSGDSVDGGDGGDGGW